MSPQSAGSYRIGGAYFARAVSLPDPILQGVAVRVGLGAAQLTAPSPSGVVDYSLSSVHPGQNTLNVETGLQAYGSPYLQVMGRHGGGESGDASYAGLAYGGFVGRLQYGDGTHGYKYQLGVVPQWMLGERIQLQVFGSLESSGYNGDYTFIAPSGRPPPSPPTWRRNYGPDWAINKQINSNAGMLVRAAPTDRLLLKGSVFFSDNDILRGDFTALTFMSRSTASASLVRTPDSNYRSWSGQAEAAYLWATQNLPVTLIAGVRLRDSLRTTHPSATADMGQISLSGPSYVRPQDPVFLPLTNLDHVQQVYGSFGLRATALQKVTFQGVVHRALNEKRVTLAGRAPTTFRDWNWLYNMSATVDLGRRSIFYVAMARGMEESGTAPPNATNRNTILPVVVAESREIGFQHSVGPMVVTGSLFEIEKPIAGLRPDNIYGFVGYVRHAGIDLSAAGPLTPSLRVVAGATIFNANLNGQLVSQGLVGRRPLGVSPTILYAGMNYSTPWSKNLSVDAQVSYTGTQPGNLANTFILPAVTKLNLGARYAFLLEGRAASLRLVASNIAAQRIWTVNSSGTFSVPQPPSIRLSLGIDLGRPS